jgi:hypothetical protein
MDLNKKEAITHLWLLLQSGLGNHQVFKRKWLWFEYDCLQNEMIVIRLWLASNLKIMIVIVLWFDCQMITKWLSNDCF